jgi:hypothetical protein
MAERISDKLGREVDSGNRTKSRNAGGKKAPGKVM